MKKPILQLLMLAVVLTAMRGHAAFYTVTSTADNTDSAAHGGAGTAGSPFQMSSLRGAIIAANAAAGADTITLPAGAYTLTLANAGSLNEDGCLTGDLDVKDSLTINGAGAAATIVQAGSTAAGGLDKVFAINPLCDHAVAFTLTGVTVRFGRNTQAYGAADFSFTGGGIDFCGNGASSCTLRDCVVTNNYNVNGYGGGMNIDEVAPATSVVTITNTVFANNTAGYWGGGLNIFGDDVQVTISAGTFTGNQTIGAGGAGSQGGGINIRITGQTAGTTPFVTINNNTVVSNNTAHGYGGGVCLAGGGNQNLTIQNSRIVGNTVLNNGAIASRGGGLYHDNNASRTTTLTSVLIANNHADSLAGAAGGGIFVGSGVFNLTYSRIVGNTAPNGSGLAQSAGTVTAINNWWGNNAPAGLMSGTVSFTPWLMLRHAASPNTITVPNSTTLTATFLTNSAGTFISSANLGVLTGVPITFNNAVLGTLSGAQATVQSSATATATFTGTAGGAASADASVDGQTVTTPITVNVMPSINCPADIVTNASGYCVPSIAFGSTVTAGFPAPVVAYKLGATAITSPYAFPIGTNIVTSTATNVAGTNSCSFTVKVFAGTAPQLSILRSSTNVVVSWSNSFPCYALQFAPVLAGNSWSMYPGPFATNNGKIFVTNSSPFTNRFFRLSF